MPYDYARWGDGWGCNDTTTQCPVTVPFAAVNTQSAALLTTNMVPTAAQMTASMQSDVQVAAIMTAYDNARVRPCFFSPPPFDACYFLVLVPRYSRDWEMIRSPPPPTSLST